MPAAHPGPRKEDWSKEQRARFIALHRRLHERFSQVEIQSAIRDSWVWAERKNVRRTDWPATLINWLLKDRERRPTASIQREAARRRDDDQLELLDDILRQETHLR